MNISPVPNDQAYKRLKALYGISKLLTSLENIQKTFPEIVALASETFPLATAVLIQCRETEHKTSQWRSVNATPEQLVWPLNMLKWGVIIFAARWKILPVQCSTQEIAQITSFCL